MQVILLSMVYFLQALPTLTLRLERLLQRCSRNAKSQLEPVIEHLVGRQGQPRGVQVHATHLSDQKGWSQDPPLPRPHLRVGSGGKDLLLQIPAHLKSSKG